VEKVSNTNNVNNNQPTIGQGFLEGSISGTEKIR
jgi:hypothetical protein